MPSINIINFVMKLQTVGNNFAPENETISFEI